MQCTLGRVVKAYGCYGKKPADTVWILSAQVRILQCAILLIFLLADPVQHVWQGTCAAFLIGSISVAISAGKLDTDLPSLFCWLAQPDPGIVGWEHLTVWLQTLHPKSSLCSKQGASTCVDPDPGGQQPWLPSRIVSTSTVSLNTYRYSSGPTPVVYRVCSGHLTLLNSTEIVGSC